MIHYDLVCECGERFDAWFRSSVDFDEQARANMIACPSCASTKIEKALMAPAVQSAKKRALIAADASAPGDDTNSFVAGSSPALAEATNLLRKIVRHVRDNADDVGRSFPDEARKIHYGEVEPRSIIGEATPGEAKELLEEGVSFSPLPKLPEERN